MKETLMFNFKLRIKSRWFVQGIRGGKGLYKVFLVFK